MQEKTRRLPTLWDLGSLRRRRHPFRPSLSTSPSLRFVFPFPSRPGFSLSLLFIIQNPLSPLSIQPLSPQSGLCSAHLLDQLCGGLWQDEDQGQANSAPRPLLWVEGGEGKTAGGTAANLLLPGEPKHSLKVKEAERPQLQTDLLRASGMPQLPYMLSYKMADSPSHAGVKLVTTVLLFPREKPHVPSTPHA